MKLIYNSLVLLLLCILNVLVIYYLQCKNIENIQNNSTTTYPETKIQQSINKAVATFKKIIIM